MNSIFLKKIFVLTVCMLIIKGLPAQSPKRDVRATWLSTVWALDWPKVNENNITVPAATGTNEAAREAARSVQKSSLISLIDRLYAANFNTIFFQVRGMSDAFYKSKYEPWSQWLSSPHGADPGWDPLAFAIDEAHKRGMELHAWLNPYRYSTSSSSHTGLSNDYEVSHPDWLLDYGSHLKYLNPGMPEVRQRICDVIADIVENYDVDGIVFDDYFYANGTTDAMDNAQYQAYNPNGLTRNDWRRENINQMVRDVQAKINSIKPYVTFGIGPAGVSASSASHAEKYGVEPSPGSDWQYNSIFSDPLAWLKDGSIDYISPQLYWPIGGSPDYSLLSPWWSKVANKFGRHFYSSNTSSYANAYNELPAEVNVNRDADRNGVTGAVYFRTASNNLAKRTLDSLKNKVYQRPALRAVYAWKKPTPQNSISGLTIFGQNLTWNYENENVRYTIYAIPNANRNDADVFTSTKYLQGISYSKTYTLAAGISNSTHKIAVAIYDRYGYEYPPRVLGESETTAATPVLKYPVNGATGIVLPAIFTWNSEEGIIYYIWEIAKDAAFTQPIASYEVFEAKFNSGVLVNIQNDSTYYWRVKAIKPNAPIATSAVWSFNGTKFSIISPKDAATNVSLTPTITWQNIGTGASYTLEISRRSNFSEINYSTTVQTTQVTVPEKTLATATTYYVRVYASLGSIQAISEHIAFKTEEQEIPIPVIISPADGATIDGKTLEICWQQQPATNFRIEISQDISFPSRNIKVKTVEWNETCVAYDNLTAGIWYARVKAGSSIGQTEPSSVISVYLNGQTGLENIKSTDLCYGYHDGANGYKIIINSEENTTATIQIFSTTGVLLEQQTYGLETGKTTISPNIEDLNKGIYLIKVTTGTIKKTIKVTK